MPGDSAGQVFDVAAFERQTGGDAGALVSAAHSLKGACGYLSAAAAREQAAHLEQIGRQGRMDEAEADAALARLDAAVAALLPELRKQLS